MRDGAVTFETSVAPTVISTTSEAERFVRAIVDEGLYATGAQLYLQAGGTVLVDDAWGDCAGRPVRVDSMHSAFCATKPLMGLAVGHAVDRGLVELDTAIGDMLATPWVDPSVTLRAVLAHRAGLSHPSATAWRMAPPRRRESLIPLAPAPTPAYSEIVGWQVLSRVIDTATGLDAGAFLNATVLDPIGLDSVCVTPERALRALAEGRVRVPVGGLPHEVVPLLSEQLPSQVAETSLAFGGLVSMSDMGRLYSALSSALRGADVLGMPTPSTLHDLLRPVGGSEWDPVVRRSCSFAGGFMTDLVAHRISSALSASAVGHAAGIATCVAFCDPATGVVLALYLNGSAMSPLDIETARMSLIDQIVTEVTSG